MLVSYGGTGWPGSSWHDFGRKLESTCWPTSAVRCGCYFRLGKCRRMDLKSPCKAAVGTQPGISSSTDEPKWWCYFRNVFFFPARLFLEAE